MNSNYTGALEWDADVGNILTPTVLLTILVIAALFAFLCFGLWMYERMYLVEVLGGVVICTLDVISDWMLIADWYSTGDKGWASWMLASVILGGQISAEALRQRDAEEKAEQCKKSSCTSTIKNYFIDLIGFSVIRTSLLEYRIKKIRQDRRSKKAVSKGGKNELSTGRRLTTSLSLNLIDLFCCVSMGGIVESLISFCVIAYYIISGTVSDHPDVSEPQNLTYLTWIFSYFGILYKMVVFDQFELYRRRISETQINHYRREDEIQKTGWKTFCRDKIEGILRMALPLWFMTLCTVVPAFILAQRRNNIKIPICPEVLSSRVGLSYLVPAIMLVSLWTRRFYWKGETVSFLGLQVGTVSFFLEEVGSIWLVLTQLWIHFYGSFRTSLGWNICWFWTIGAIMKLTETVFLLVCCKEEYGKLLQTLKKCVSTGRKNADTNEHQIDMADTQTYSHRQVALAAPQVE